MLKAFISKFYNIIIVILLTIIVSLCISIYFLNLSRESLQTDLNDSNRKLALCEASKTSLKAELEDQNKQIEQHEIKYENKLKEYEQWKNKPIEIRYEYIKKEVKSNECEDIKKSIDASVNRLSNNRLLPKTN